MQRSSVFRIDRFLGLNQSVDQTELKIGEAAEMVNWTITRDGNIRRRPGILYQDFPIKREPFAKDAKLTGVWSGFYGGDYRIACVFGNINRVDHGETFLSVFVMYHVVDGELEELTGFRWYMKGPSTKPSKVFFCDGKLTVCTDSATAFPLLGLGTKNYEPLFITTASPDGGGVEVEPINIVSTRFRARYSGDGKATVYKLPDIVTAADARIDGTFITDGTFDGAKHTYTFVAPPDEGVNNIEFTCTYADPDISLLRAKFYSMPYTESYNGSTDNRVFFYGDGTNSILYSGQPAHGSGFYIPLGNEITLNDSPAPVTGLCRQDTVLMAFKPDGAHAIRYSPLTLPDGKVIAGFYATGVSKEIGNEVSAMGQVQLCNNYTRSITNGTIYEWHSSNGYQDQRYTKDIGRKVSPTLRRMGDIKTADDDINSTYYLLSGDTMLVNRYDADTWAIYKSDLFHAIRYIVTEHGMVFGITETGIMRFVDGLDFDTIKHPNGETETFPIRAVWKSGFMSFGADWRRKYSSEMWISTFPEPSSRMTVTVHTDKRNGYTRKVVGNNIFDWYSNVDYANWSYNVSRTPKIKRTKLKVKKFVYYQLVFEVENPGARAMVLSADIAVNFAGPVK